MFTHILYQHIGGWTQCWGYLSDHIDGCSLQAEGYSQCSTAAPCCYVRSHWTAIISLLLRPSVFEISAVAFNMLPKKWLESLLKAACMSGKSYRMKLDLLVQTPWPQAESVPLKLNVNVTPPIGSRYSWGLKCQAAQICLLNKTAFPRTPTGLKLKSPHFSTSQWVILLLLVISSLPSLFKWFMIHTESKSLVDSSSAGSRINQTTSLTLKQ